MILLTNIASKFVKSLYIALIKSEIKANKFTAINTIFNNQTVCLSILLTLNLRFYLPKKHKQVCKF